MATIIEYGNSIPKLLSMLAEYALDPRFGSFISGPLVADDFVKPLLAPAEFFGKTQFSGNFYTYSFAFMLYTDDPDLIATLTAAIEKNQATELYREAEQDYAEAARQNRLRRERIEAAKLAERVAQARATLANARR